MKDLGALAKSQIIIAKVVLVIGECDFEPLPWNF